jgi:DNA polymerase IV
MPSSRKIIHADLDAFFASVEQRDDPKLAGKPVIIGADPKYGRGRGVVSTCSYEARKFGVCSAMPISLAYRKCPQGIFLPPDMEKYSRASRQIFQIFYSFTPQIESISLDEAFLDITGSHHLFGGPENLCRQLKSRVKKDAGLTLSVGLAPNKMAAKIASDLKKPDGLVVVKEEGLLDFLRPLAVEKIWGLGKKAGQILKDRGVKTIGDLAKKNTKELVNIFGKAGLEYWELANGIDEREVEPAGAAKSISNETTFSEDTFDKEKIERELMRLSDKVAGRLRRDELRGKTVTLKIRLRGFLTFTRAHTFGDPTDITDTIFKEAKKLFYAFDLKGKPIRLIGVKVSHFGLPDNQLDLFKLSGDDKKEKVEKAVDKIREKFGSKAIFRGLNATD